MKKIYIFLVLIIVAIVFNPACKDDDENAAVPNETTPYTAGQTISYSFAAGQDTVVKLIDEVVNYGTGENPILFIVFKEQVVMTDGYEYIFFPLYREKLEVFMPLWANQYGLNFLTEEERAFVHQHFLDYIVLNELDAGLLVELIIGEGYALPPVINMIDKATNLKSCSEGDIPTANDLLYRLKTEKLSPELMTEQLNQMALKGTTSNVIVTIFKSILQVIDTWVSFTKDNKAVTDMSDNYMSFLNAADTVQADYTGGTAYNTKDYHLSYDAGALEAKCTYHLEIKYNAVHATIPGKYIPYCNTKCTEARAVGAGFVVKGKTCYSPAINAGSFEVPVADMNGKVSVEYGDCCCFRKFSYLNFKINAGTGYTETSWSPGK